MRIPLPGCIELSAEFLTAMCAYGYGEPPKLKKKKTSRAVKATTTKWKTKRGKK